MNPDRRLALAGLITTVCAPAVRAADDPALAALLDAPHRSAANRARDAARHPVQTLGFFGLQPQHTVLELAPGAGWYTELLAPYLRERGRLFTAHYAADDPAAGRRSSRAGFEAKLARDPALYSRVVVGSLPQGGRFADLQMDGGVDLVLTFRNLHNWLEDQVIDGHLRAILGVLKPGGILGVVDHRAAPGTALAQQQSTGYLTEALVTERALAAGFLASGRSEVNANPRDTKDHPHGVWSLPPTLRGGEVDRARFLAIGESDRLTHRYQKPLA